MYRTKEELVKGINAKLDSFVSLIDDHEFRLKLKAERFYKFFPKGERRERASNKLNYINPNFSEALLEVEKDVNVVKKIENLRKSIKMLKKNMEMNWKTIKYKVFELYKLTKNTKGIEELADDFRRMGWEYESAKIYGKLFDINPKNEYLENVKELKRTLEGRKNKKFTYLHTHLKGIERIIFKMLMRNEKQPLSEKTKQEE